MIRGAIVSCLFLASLFVLTQAGHQPLASFHGDPHFQGADGIHFDFTGEPGSAYCLFSDPSIHINMGMAGHEAEGKGLRTWVKALGILSGKHSVEMHAREGADADRGQGFVELIKVDGQAVSIPEGKRLRTKDAALSLEFAGSVAFNDAEEDVESYVLGTDSGLQLLVKAKAENLENRGTNDAMVHFSVEVLEAPRLSNPHGVMGQTFRPEQRQRTFTFKTEWSSMLKIWQVAGPNGEDYLDGDVDDYATSTLMNPDCKFSRFDQMTSSQNVDSEQTLTSASVSQAVQLSKRSDPTVNRSMSGAPLSAKGGSGMSRAVGHVQEADSTVGVATKGEEAQVITTEVGQEYQKITSVDALLPEPDLQLTEDELLADAAEARESQEVNSAELQVPTTETLLASDVRQGDEDTARVVSGAGGAFRVAEADSQPIASLPVYREERQVAEEAEEAEDGSVQSTEVKLDQVAPGKKIGSVESDDESISQPLHVYRTEDGSLREDSEPEDLNLTGAQVQNKEAETVAGLEAAVLEELPVRTIRARPRKLLSASETT